jgi:hypothetical protein
MTRPTVVISLDLELSWGSFDLSFGDDLLEMGRWTHDVGAPNLLRHLTRNRLSATWAVVGAMMRPALPDVSGLPEVNFSHFPKPWFSYVPKGGDESTHPEWFGASLVEMIRNAHPEQEIGFHSFSHVPFGRAGMTRERAIAEYQRCMQIARELGIPPRSFVFPRNSVAYVAELGDAGFTCFRDVDQLPVRFANGNLTSIAMILADFAGLAPRMVEPSLKEGIVSIPGSLMIRYAAGWRRLIPDSSRLRRLRKGLEIVRRKGGVFHVWFHPENLYAEWPRLENVVARFLEELGVLVRNGEVRCVTMGQLANEFQASFAAKQGYRLRPSHSPTEYVHFVRPSRNFGGCPAKSS